jgi:hypothetical protein
VYLIGGAAGWVISNIQQACNSTTDVAFEDNEKPAGRITPLSPSGNTVAVDEFAPGRFSKPTASLHIAGSLRYEPVGLSKTTTSPGTTKIGNGLPGSFGKLNKARVPNLPVVGVGDAEQRPEGRPTSLQGVPGKIGAAGVLPAEKIITNAAIGDSFQNVSIYISSQKCRDLSRIFSDYFIELWA